MHWTLQAAPESAAIARGLVRDGVAACGRDVESTAVLLTDELVTNAVLHGAGPLQLALCVDAHRLRVAVSDTSAGRPVELDPRSGHTRTSGRGLFLVDSLSTRWGVDARAVGKQVWFELDLE